MKYIVMLAVAVLPFLAKGQQIDTTINCGLAVKIKPFKVKYDDTTQAQYITLKVVENDLDSRCVFYYTLIDNNCNVLDDGNEQMKGEDYKKWDRSTIAAFVYVMNRKRIKTYSSN